MKTNITENVKEMGSYDLMHNSFFIRDREVWYRDFEREISAYDLIREMHEKLLGDKRLVRKLEGDFLDDEYLDDLLLDHSQYGTDKLEGVIAMFYSILCGAAGVRAELIERREEIDAVEQDILKLKAIEALESKGQLNKLIKVNNVWYVNMGHGAKQSLSYWYESQPIENK